MNDRRARDRLGLILIAGCLVLLGIGFGLGALVQSQEPVRDPVTMCSEGKPVTGHVAIVLDRTDPLSEGQEEAVLDQVRSIEQRLKAGSLLSVWVVGDYEEGSVRRLYCRCYPGRRAQPLWQNPNFVSAICDSLFTGPLRSQIQSLPPQEQAGRSPILSAIREISQQPEFTDVQGPREIVLISDLMENTASFSLYQDQPDFQTFRSLGISQRTRADLRGVTVNVHYVGRRENPVSTADLLEFWRAYFADCHAAAVRFHRL